MHFMEMAVDLEQLAIDMHWLMHSQGHGGCFESTSHMALFKINFYQKTAEMFCICVSSMDNKAFQDGK